MSPISYQQAAAMARDIGAIRCVADIGGGLLKREELTDKRFAGTWSARRSRKRDSRMFSTRRSERFWRPRPRRGRSPRAASCARVPPDLVELSLGGSGVGGGIGRHGFPFQPSSPPLPSLSCRLPLLLSFLIAPYFSPPPPPRTPLFWSSPRCRSSPDF